MAITMIYATEQSHHRHEGATTPLTETKPTKSLPPIHDLTFSDYVQVLWLARRLVISIMLTALLLAVVVALLLPNTYVARALVLFREPVFDFRFEERQFQGRNLDDQLYLSTNNALVGMALSDDVLQQTATRLTEAGVVLPEPLEYLRDRADATLNFGNSLVTLSMWDRDAERAAQLTNAWLAVFVERANEIFGQDATEVQRLQIEQEQVTQTRSNAETALTDFRERDTRPALGAQLDASKERYESYQDQLEALALLHLDIDSFAVQLRQRATDAPLGLGDLYVAMRLQGAVHNAQEAPPLDLQLELPEVTLGNTQNTADMLAFLDELRDSLQDRQSAIRDALAALEATILRVQTQTETLNIEAANLQQELDVARLAYYRVDRRLEEARIADSVVNEYVQVSARAVTPVKPIDLPGWLLVGVAGGVGMLLGLAAAFLRAYWYLIQPRAEATERKA
jgi:uncharacterized protein involved in exopolysaccharide biosynthesis